MYSGIARRHPRYDSSGAANTRALGTRPGDLIQDS